MQSGYLLALLEEAIREYDDLIHHFMEGSRVDDSIYVVPQILCTDLLYTRKGDSELENMENLPYITISPLPFQSIFREILGALKESVTGRRQFWLSCSFKDPKNLAGLTKFPANGIIRRLHKIPI